MRLSKTQNQLNTRLKNTIRRSYPLIGSQSLNESYLDLTEPITGLNLMREPWLQALPKYEPLQDGFDGLNDLLSEDSKEFVQFLKEMNDKGRGDIFPPYTHQAKSILAWDQGKDFVVSTGTGSGKTECFLYPILGHLYRYASKKIDQIKEPSERGPSRGIKALVLYPMNALVGDQLKRMRTLLGDFELAKSLARDSLVQGGKHRFFQFGSYTGRTRFPGPYAYESTGRGRKNKKVQKNGSATKYVRKFVELESSEKTGPSQGKNGLYLKMMDKGLIPAKGKPKIVEGTDIEYWSLDSFLNDDGEDKLITRHEDRELLLRHEMHNVGYSSLKTSKDGPSRITPSNNGGGTPDVLITNYSMLEYMLKRPLEHIMFHETREWLNEDTENKLLLVLDEAHLYQGALGTEIGMLVKRLRMTLGLADKEDKIQFILTSASLGSDAEKKRDFVQGLTGRDSEWFEDQKTEFIDGVKWDATKGLGSIEPFDPKAWISAFEGLNINATDEEITEAVCNVFDVQSDQLPIWFRKQELYMKLYNRLSENTISISELSEYLFEDSEDSTKKITELILNFVAALVGETNIPGRTDTPLLGIRAHLLYRGLGELHWNLAKDITQATSSSSIFSEMPEAIYPLYSCRRCGGAYAQVFIESTKPSPSQDSTLEKCLKNQAIVGRTFNSPYPNTAQLELYVCDRFDIETRETYKNLQSRELKFDEPPDLFISVYQMSFMTRRFFDGLSSEEQISYLETYKPCYLPRSNTGNGLPVPTTQTTFVDSECDIRYTFNSSTCLQCQTDHSRRQSDQITSLMTRGDQAFSSLSLGLHESQDNVPGVKTPNRGKKVLIFSDGRQRAARMAKTIQDFANNDELRMSLMHLLYDEWYKKFSSKYFFKSLSDLYEFYVVHITAAMQDPFEETASYFSPKEMFANNREQVLARHLAGIAFMKIQEGYEVPLLDDGDKQKIRSFVLKINEVGNEDTFKAFAERFVSPETGKISEYDDFLTIFKKSNGWNLLKHLRSNVILKNVLHRGDYSSDETLAFFGSFVNLIYENHESGSNQLPALTVEDLRAKFSEQGASGRTDPAYLEGVLERWDLIRGEQAPNDEQLQTFCQLKDKQFEKLKPILRQQFAQYRHILRKIFDDLKPVELYDQYVQKAIFLLRNDYNSLEDYATLGLQIKQIELAIFDDSSYQERFMQMRNYIFSRVRIYFKSGANAPQFFFTQLIDFISSRDFSFSDLGISRINIDQGTLDRIISELTKGYVLPESVKEGEHYEQLKLLLEAMLIFPITSHQKFQLAVTGKDSSRGVRDENNHFTIYAAREHPREYVLKKDSRKWGVTIPMVKSYLREVVRVPENFASLVPNLDTFIEAITPYLYINEGDGRFLSRADLLELELAVSANEGQDEIDSLMCIRCGTALLQKYDVHIRTCSSCGASNEENISAYNPTDPLVKLRIEDPWRVPLRTALSTSTEEMGITLVRAEEHTAQINDPTNNDDMYSHAERFEMLFQDLPLVTPQSNAPFSMPEAPIDILSCTTTMEVGIDIGSLTAVALRTVPRERANYQQRVGRAGRGRSEVCVALSWYDNKPYAQHFFLHPNEIIDHPDDAPIIYLENSVIIQRHIWAAIMQRFFKRLKFEPASRSFFGMSREEQSAGLMDSMGTTDDFMNSDPIVDENLYCRVAMRNWINSEEVDNLFSDKDGEDARVYSWEETRDNLASLLPSDLIPSIELRNGDSAETSEEVIDDWAQILLHEFDLVADAGEGDEVE